MLLNSMRWHVLTNAYGHRTGACRWAVATYLLGGTLDDGFEITPKYIGNGRLIEIAHCH